jgi:transcriptional/translational regulatory protein YebC/TACO1
VRHAFSKWGGNIAESGAVSWNFEPKGLLGHPLRGLVEDEFMMIALECGAEDVVMETRA